MVEIDNLDKIFIEIQKKFVNKLKNTQTHIKDLLQKISSNEFLGDLSGIRTETHKIAGSARTFRFPDLSIIARKAEESLEENISEKPTEKSIKELENQIKEFLKEIEKTILSHESKKNNSSETINESQPKISSLSHQAQTFTKKNEGKSHQILVADDDELVRTLLSQGLKKSNCEVIEVEDGQYAIDYLNSCKEGSLPKVIILDINMPRKNGFEVLKSLKENKIWQKIPVVMLTRRDEGENVVKGISTGAVDYISKPFKVPELVEKIFNILNLQEIKVLITDDDELICDLLSQRFKKMGYSTLIANNGNDGLKLMKEEKPNIVILDIMMPGMDGLTVLKQAQNDPETANIPVVLLTAKSQQDNLLKGLQSGAHDYITKPFDVDEVAARVSGILQRAKKG